MPSLVSGALTQAGWLRTFAVALVAFAAVNVLEGLARVLLERLALGEGTLVMVRMVVSLLTVALGGYVAARIRRPASLVLAATIFVTVFIMLLGNPQADPFRYATFLIGAPLAATFAGAAAARHPVRPS